MKAKKTFSTRIDAECLKALKHLAVDEDKSLGELLEEAIEDLIKKYEKKKRRWWNRRLKHAGRVFNPKERYGHVCNQQQQLFEGRSPLGSGFWSRRYEWDYRRVHLSEMRHRASPEIVLEWAGETQKILPALQRLRINDRTQRFLRHRRRYSSGPGKSGVAKPKMTMDHLMFGEFAAFHHFLGSSL